MSTRQAILARVREALGSPTDPHVRASTSSRTPPPSFREGLGEGPAHVVTPPESDGFRAWLPTVGETFEQRVSLFAAHSELLKTAFHHVPDESAMLEVLRHLATRDGWSGVGSHRNALNAAACEALSLPVTWTDDGYDAGKLERCDAAITGCEGLIAQTGSVLITGASSGGRALSVLPPHHVVLARREQMLPDLTAGYRHLRQRYGDAYPSFMSFITGPSRTGDIERILVLGAHGPRRLTVILVD